MWPRIPRGVVALADGTTAANTVTCLDMAVRRRPADPPMTGPAVSGRSRWSASTCLRDLVPHLAYGAVAAGTVADLERDFR
jgi:hypothetical protein